MSPYIHSEETAATSGEWFDTVNPATGEVLCHESNKYPAPARATRAPKNRGKFVDLNTRLAEAEEMKAEDRQGHRLKAAVE